MIDIKKHISIGFGKGELHDVLVQMQLEAGMLPISGKTYFVSAYGNNTTGLSWETAYTTIAAAIAASNTYIALGTVAGGRNRIYIDSNGGDNWAETLTVFPNQCDMIGVGSKAGWMTTIYGITTIGTACLGTHIYNLRFINPTTADAVITIPDGSHGFEIYKCRIRNNSGNDSSAGIKIGSLWDFTIADNFIYGNPPCVIGIELDGVACGNSEIKNNFISATTTGIAIANGTTSDYGLVIRNNIIFRADPNSDSAMAVGIDFRDTQGRTHACVIDNRIGAVDCIQFDGTVSGNRDHWMCLGNIVSASGGVVADWESPPTTP